MKFRKIINCIMNIGVLGILLCSFLFACRGALDINEYENRYAEKIKPFSLATYLSGDFQNSMEEGLSDQLPFAILLKEKYNRVLSKVNMLALEKARSYYTMDTMPDDFLTEAEMNIKLEELAKEEAERILKQQQAEARGVRKETIATPSIKYINLGEHLLYGDHLVYACRNAESSISGFESRLNNLNEVMAAHPETEYYMYYVENSVDVQFEKGTRSNIWEILCSLSDLPEENRAAFMIHSYGDYKSAFFTTDHHWNYRGSYKAYKNMLKWLLPYEEPLLPVATWDLGTFSGSMAKGDLSNFSEMFTVYEFDYPPVTTTVNGNNVASYNGLDRYIQLAKEGKPCGLLTYGLVYGQDNGEVIFENPNSENGSLLILGDSYDNALIRLLASHFRKVVVIDQRNYKAQMGKDFVFTDYLAQGDFDKVLFCGSFSYWNSSTFHLR